MYAIELKRQHSAESIGVDFAKWAGRRASDQTMLHISHTNNMNKKRRCPQPTTKARDAGDAVKKTAQRGEAALNRGAGQLKNQWAS